MRRAHTRGFGLLLTLFGMGFLVLTLGAGIDISHIYLVQSELQAQADEIALSAARELDGTAEGIERVRSMAETARVASERDPWFAFNTDHLTKLSTEFASDGKGPWENAPREPAGYRFVRVSVSAAAQLYFMSMLPVDLANQQVAVVSKAGQMRLKETGIRSAAYATEAVEPGEPDFGFAANEVRPLRLERTGDCAGILSERFRLDTDTTSSTYDEYARFGNGQRVIFAAVGGGDGAPVGNATFLVVPEVTVSGKCEAAYAGNSPVRNAARDGAGGPGFYEVRLYQ